MQLRIMHRNGGYRHVLELGRIFFRSQPQPACIPVARIATIVAQSMLALRHPVEAKALFEQILELYKRLGSNEGVADTLLGIANTQLLDCHWDEADALYQEARFRYEEMGQSDKALACMINLGILRAKRGELAGGRSVLLQALNRVSQLGDTRRRLGVQLGLGYVEMRLGDLKTARHWLLASLRLARAQNSMRSRGLAFEFLGELYLWQGQLGRARRCLEAGHVIARQLVPDGDLDFEIQRRLAELSLREGALQTARSYALEAQRMARRYGDTCEVAAADRVLAEVELSEGRVYDALKRTATARTVLGRIGENFERTRLELLSIRLERRAGLLPASRTPARVKEACRYYANAPGCLVHWEEILLAASGSLAGQRWISIEEARPRAFVSASAPGSLRTFKSAAHPSSREAVQTESTQLSVVLVGDALRVSGWNIAAAARSLGTSRSRLDRFIRNHGLCRPARGNGA
jgi:tetratricopeptide (TPR) repeat protein